MFSGITAVAETGQMTYVSGPRGSGKTLLLKSLLGLEELSSGYLTFDGDLLTPRSAPYFRQHIAYVPQDIRFVGETLRDLWRDVPAMSDLRGRTEEAPRRLSEECRLLGAEARWADMPLAELAPWQIRLLLLAAAGCRQTDVLLADCPTAEMSHEATMRVWTYLQTLAERGTTVVASRWADCHELQVNHSDTPHTLPSETMNDAMKNDSLTEQN